MQSLYILIPVALVFVAVALVAFLWAVNSNQFDDLDKEAHRILFDEDRPDPPPRRSAQQPGENNGTPD